MSLRSNVGVSEPIEREVPVKLTRLLSILAIVSVVACRGDDRDVRRDAERHFTSARSSPDSILEVGRTDAGPWTRVFAFGPYTSRRLMDSVIGASVSAAAASRIEGSDDVNMLIFADGRGVLAHAAVSRTFGDFCQDAMNVAHPRAQARFIFSRSVASHGGCFARLGASAR